MKSSVVLALATVVPFAIAGTTAIVTSATVATTTTITRAATTPTPTPASCVPGLRIVQGRQCKIECSTDHPGGDYAKKKTGSFEGCVQACAADTRCVTAQYHKDNGFCYLKKSLKPAKSNTNDDTVICDNSPPASRACNVTQHPYIASNGKAFMFECEATYEGNGSYDLVAAADFQTCIEICAQSPTCLALDFASPDYADGAYKDTPCILLHAVGDGREFFEGLDRAALITSPQP